MNAGETKSTDRARLAAIARQAIMQRGLEPHSPPTRQRQVAGMGLGGNGLVVSSELYRGRVRNRAKLAYRSVAAWLDGQGPPPRRIVETAGLDENLRVQDRVAQRLVELRHRQGALSLESLE